MSKESRIYLSAPHMGGDEQSLIQEAFQTNWIAPLGPHVDAFEKEMADYLSVKGAVALSSGTAAIHLALRLLGVGQGDRVFVSSLTFIASANPIIYQGAEPVFIDSEPGSWNMSPRALEAAFQAAEKAGAMPKAVIIVDLYGQSADKDRLFALCQKYGVPVVEDAAEALGATYKGRMAGSMGEFGIFSFNGNKIITTSGGGMLVSNNLEALQTARFWATQARDPAPHYQHSQIGYNYRLSNVLAAIGRGQLRVLSERIERRREIFRRYTAALSHIPGICWMPEAEYGRANRWLTVATLDPSHTSVTPSDILTEMEKVNIECRPVWKPLHLQPVFEGCSYYRHQPDLSVCDQLFYQGICLPSGSGMNDNDQDRVIATLKKLFS